ncbi:MAG: replication restart helicase PriA [Anaerolineae bacterium]
MQPRVLAGGELGEDIRGPRVAAFHYMVPTRLESAICLGQWVWVPFGSRNLSGIVVALDTQPPDVELREIVDIIDTRPVLTEAQLALAQWISEYYLAPLFDCLSLFLPPGASPRAEVLYRLVPRQLPRLTANQRLIVTLLQKHGVLSKRQLERLLLREIAAEKRERKRALLSLRGLDALLRQGVVEHFSRLAPGRTGPHYQEAVRLAVAPAEAERLLAEALADSAPARALLLLARAQEEGDPLVPLSHLREATGLSRATLNRLASAGLLLLTPETVLVAARHGGEAVATSGAPKAGKAQALLDELKQRGPVERSQLLAAGHSRQTIGSLVRQGLVEEQLLPESVCLAVTSEQALDFVLSSANMATYRRLLQILQRQPGPLWLSELLREGHCGKAAVQRLVQVGIVAIERRRFYRDPLAEMVPKPMPLAELTEQQSAALEPLTAALVAGKGKAFLLHGVTGSGKTETYLRAIEQALALGQQAIVLVPEIALTPQTIRRFAAHFPGRIAIQHSELSEGERYDQWTQIRDGAADIVIGSRSALFAPLPRRSLIIMDEEHDSSYKQESCPRYHARDVALQMARLDNSIVILGSATPDVCTYRAAKRGELTLLSLPRRYGPGRPAPMPPVQVVDMRQELRLGHTGLFSEPLRQALAETLARGEQAILFLNRRGSATFVMCRDCGYVARCPRCHLPLTQHLSDAGAGKGTQLPTPTQAEAPQLICHHCGYRATPPRTCPDCAGARIRYFGAGTERLQAYTQALFPQARIVRWDRDTTRAKGGHDAILELFLRHQADILVGTQMVTKGLDLPLVTLVGVVAADTALFLPDYRAGERAFQLLTQVAGRAGRSDRGGRAIIQTYHPEHYAIAAASQHDYESFYRQEIERRQQLGYPPFGQMIRLLHVSNSARLCREGAEQLAARLRLRIRQLGLPNLEVIGPSSCFYSRLRGRYRWHIILRGQGGQELLRQEAIPLGWRVDVDPVSFL